jgi:flagellin-like protein
MMFRKFRKNVKAISPVISVLLMIAVAVVASLVVYAWVMGYIGFQSSKTGQAVQVQSVAFSGGKVATVYLQNIGDGPVTVIPAQALYVNGVLDTGATATGLTSGSLLEGATATITASSAQVAYASGTMVTIKVTTEGGTYSQITQQVP